MKSITTLPAHYKQRGELDLSKKKVLMIVLNIAAIPLFFLFGWLFLAASSILAPSSEVDYQVLAFISDDIYFNYFGLLLLGIIPLIVVHELIHGFFFWIFTRARPVFGIKLLFAYAATPPGYYIPRNQNIIVGMAPLVLMSLLGLTMIPFLSGDILLALIFYLALNAASSVGDIYITGRLLMMPASYLFTDLGTNMLWYGPVKSTEQKVSEGVSHD